MRNDQGTKFVGLPIPSEKKRCIFSLERSRPDVRLNFRNHLFWRAFYFIGELVPSLLELDQEVVRSAPIGRDRGLITVDTEIFPRPCQASELLFGFSLVTNMHKLRRYVAIPLLSLHGAKSAKQNSKFQIGKPIPQKQQGCSRERVLNPPWNRRGLIRTWSSRYFNKKIEIIIFREYQRVGDSSMPIQMKNNRICHAGFKWSVKGRLLSSKVVGPSAKFLTGIAVTTAFESLHHQIVIIGRNINRKG